MFHDGRKEGPIGMVGYPELLCGPFDYGRDLAVMYMADIGEQMVLHLIVQTPDKPGKQPAVGGKIARGRQLVRGPVVIYGPVFIGKGIFHPGHDMGYLENAAYQQAGDQVHGDETRNDDPGGHGQNDDR